MSCQKEIQEYWNARSGDFSEISREELESPEAGQWIEYFSGILPHPEEGKAVRVLDCGAAAGFYTVLLAEYGCRVTAVDYSQGMVEQIKEALKKRELEADVFQMNVQELHFPDNTFDAVVSRNLFWNLEEPVKAYRELYRVLKPEGVLMVSDGNFYLHLYDGRYASAQEEQQRFRPAGCHDRHNEAKVDYSVMEKIAESLPMSKRQRPDWDLEQLIGLGYEEIHTEIHYYNGRIGRQLPVSFRISAKKQK